MARILIVEDEKRIAQFVAKGLQRQGMVTEIVGDGAEALERLEQERFDGMLLDLGLPTLSGWEVLQRLREKQVNGSQAMLPVVVMTAASDERQLEQLLALGARAYLRKPFQFETLLQTLAKALAESSS